MQSNEPASSFDCMSHGLPYIPTCLWWKGRAWRLHGVAVVPILEVSLARPAQLVSFLVVACGCKEPCQVEGLIGRLARACDLPSDQLCGSRFPLCFDGRLRMQSIIRDRERRKDTPESVCLSSLQVSITPLARRDNQLEPHPFRGMKIGSMGITSQLVLGEPFLGKLPPVPLKFKHIEN